MILFQKHSATVFCRKNPQHINASTHKDRNLSKLSGNRSDTGCHTINRKHPQGGFSCHLPVFFSYGMHPGPKNLHTPAYGSTFKKITFHLLLLSLFSYPYYSQKSVFQAIFPLFPQVLEEFPKNACTL